MKANYGILLLLFTSTATAFPLNDGGSSNDNFENSEITIKQVHLKPNQTLEVLLEIQSKTSEQDKDGDKIGSVAGQILNEFYEQKRLTHPAGEQSSGIKYNINKKPTFVAKPGNDDDEAESPVRIKTQNLPQIGTDTEVDIYEEVERTARPFHSIPNDIQYIPTPNDTPAPAPVPVQSSNIRTPADEAISIEPVKSNAELISNIVNNVNVDKPRGWNKTVVYQEPYQYQPVQYQPVQSNNNIANQAGAFSISNFDSQTQAQAGGFPSIVPVNSNNNGQISIGLDGQQNQIIPVSNIISLPEVTETPTTVAPVVAPVRVTTATTDDDDDDDEDEDEDSGSRVARTK